mmetsp:Transcript_79486/g.219868  ORF Transcript_79486/g.219868 Transcript_79486/m.219868 type:complete len:217 (-) Transcript_79486:492-1142(-)
MTKPKLPCPSTLSVPEASRSCDVGNSQCSRKPRSAMRCSSSEPVAEVPRQLILASVVKSSSVWVVRAVMADRESSSECTLLPSVGPSAWLVSQSTSRSSSARLIRSRATLRKAARLLRSKARRPKPAAQASTAMVMMFETTVVTGLGPPSTQVTQAYKSTTPTSMLQRRTQRIGNSRCAPVMSTSRKTRAFMPSGSCLVTTAAGLAPTSLAMCHGC